MFSFASVALDLVFSLLPKRRTLTIVFQDAIRGKENEKKHKKVEETSSKLTMEGATFSGTWKNGVDPMARIMEKPRTLDDVTDKTKPWQLAEILDPTQCWLVAMPDSTDGAHKYKFWCWCFGSWG